MFSRVVLKHASQENYSEIKPSEIFDFSSQLATLNTGISIGNGADTSDISISKKVK